MLPVEVSSLITGVKSALSAAEVAEAAAVTDTTASRAQREAGNYRKGKISIHGLEISIENPKGSVRNGVAADGSKWSTTMRQHYGYFAGTRGADKDHVDVFIGPDPDSELVHVVNQVKPGGGFDEHKVLLGFTTESQARKAYLSNYTPGWQGLGSIAQLTIADFKKWILAGPCRRPIKTAGVEGDLRADTAPKLQAEAPAPLSVGTRDNPGNGEISEEDDPVKLAGPTLQSVRSLIQAVRPLR